MQDDGIGMPTGSDKAKPGLGTGIVEALAKQLGGNICVIDAKPGTAVTIDYDGVVDHSRELSPAI